MLRVGILGAGFMGSTHAHAYAKLPDVQVAAIVSRGSDRAKALAAEVGARNVTAVEAVLDDPTIDVVDVCYPTDQHERLAVAALRAGKHVLLEKPMALTLESADRILAAWRESGKKLMVAHVLRFWPEYVALREIVQSGRLGHPAVAYAHRLASRPSWSDIFSKPEVLGGAVLDMQIHDDDALNWVLGQPRAVYSQGRKSDNGGWDWVLTTISYDGCAATAEGSNAMSEGWPFAMGLRVVCERGVAEYTFRGGGENLQTGAMAAGLVAYEWGQEPRPVPTSAEDAYDAEVAYFVKCIQRDEPLLAAPPEEARLAMQVAAAARHSLETGEVVRL